MSLFGNFQLLFKVGNPLDDYFINGWDLMNPEVDFFLIKAGKVGR